VRWVVGFGQGPQIFKFQRIEARHLHDPLRPLNRSINQLPAGTAAPVREGFVLIILGGIDRLANDVVINLFRQFQPRLWETRDMRTQQLTDVGWLGPRIEMDSASHRFGRCSECHESICVEKVVTDSESTQTETTEILYRVFRAHAALKHSEDMNRSAA
jgi:hypothetical protein